MAANRFSRPWILSQGHLTENINAPLNYVFSIYCSFSYWYLLPESILNFRNCIVADDQMVSDFLVIVHNHIHNFQGFTCYFSTLVLNKFHHFQNIGQIQALYEIRWLIEDIIECTKWVIHVLIQSSPHEDEAISNKKVRWLCFFYFPPTNIDIFAGLHYLGDEL